jgi:hypothetical protein
VHCPFSWAKMLHECEFIHYPTKPPAQSAKEEELEEFNRNIVGKIEVIAEFHS